MRIRCVEVSGHSGGLGHLAEWPEQGRLTYSVHYDNSTTGQGMQVFEIKTHTLRDLPATLGRFWRVLERIRNAHLDYEAA